MLKNPGILIFDEATAAVDSETEHLIQEAIDRLIAGRTTLMIAHRLSTLARANKIVVVDQGEIIECGPPAELLAKKGKYYRLVQIQSAGQGQIDGSGAGGFSASLKTFAFRCEIWYNIFEAVYRDNKQHGAYAPFRASRGLDIDGFAKFPCKQAFLLDGIIGHAIALSVLVHSITVSAKMTQCVKLRRETGFCFFNKTLLHTPTAAVRGTGTALPALRCLTENQYVKKICGRRQRSLYSVVILSG